MDTQLEDAPHSCRTPFAARPGLDEVIVEGHDHGLLPALIEDKAALDAVVVTRLVIADDAAWASRNQGLGHCFLQASTVFILGKRITSWTSHSHSPA